MKLVLLRVMEEDESVLPERPEEPLPSECCGSGCAPCVLDVYQDQLDTWRTLHDMTPQQRAAYVHHYISNKVPPHVLYMITEAAYMLAKF